MPAFALQEAKRRVDHTTAYVLSITFMNDYRTLQYFFLMLLLCILVACEIEGGVPPPATPGAMTQSSPESVPLSPTPPRPMGFRIGLMDEPVDLLPYHEDAGDRRITAPISELLFPDPLLALSYSYTTTGVLERVPSFENGDVERALVDVYLDAAGVITTTVTEVISQVQQLSVTYRWNPDLHWSDGVPVTAEDSLFAYELAQQVALGEDATSRLALLESYEVVDAHTTRAVLKPDFTNPFHFVTFWTPLPRHLLADLPVDQIMQSDFAAQPVGYGPYMIERRDRDGIRLRPNPYYAGAPPPAETLTFVFLPGMDALRAAILSGNIDVAVAERTPAEQFAFLDRDRELGVLNIVYTPGPVWEHLDFNLDVPLFQDIRVRQAIAHGINRQAMIDALFAGHVPLLDSWIVPEQPVAAPADKLTHYAYDPDEARRLLDEAGLVDSDEDGIRERDGEPITLELLTTEGSTLRTEIAQQVTADMAALGIQVNIRTLSIQDLYDPEGPLFRREFELAQFAWIANPDPGGLALWSCMAVPSAMNNWTGNNFAGWCFREADQAIRTANTSLDPAERQAAYLRQQQLFTQELPVIPLFQRLIVTLSHPTLQGLAPDPTAPITWNIHDWSRS